MQTTLKKTVTKGEIEQFLLLPQCFQLYLIIEPSVIVIFHIFVNMFSNSYAAELLYVGKSLNQPVTEVDYYKDTSLSLLYIFTPLPQCLNPVSK